MADRHTSAFFFELMPCVSRGVGPRKKTTTQKFQQPLGFSEGNYSYSMKLRKETSVKVNLCKFHTKQEYILAWLLWNVKMHLKLLRIPQVMRSDINCVVAAVRCEATGLWSLEKWKNLR